MLKVFVADETQQKFNARKIFNNEWKSKGNIFDLVLNQMGWLVCSLFIVH